MPLVGLLVAPYHFIASLVGSIIYIAVCKNLNGLWRPLKGKCGGSASTLKNFLFARKTHSVLSQHTAK